MINTSYSGYQEWKNWSHQEFGKYNTEQSIYYKKECIKCGLTNLSGLNIVEIGFGNGSFAGWAIHSGAKYYGIETIPELVDIGKAMGFNTYSSETPWQEITTLSSIDLVVAFDVFEHIEINLLTSMLKEVHKYMGKNSVLMFRVPSGDSPFSRSIQHGDLTHCTVLGSSAIYQLAANTGFEVHLISSPAFALWGQGVISFIKRSIVTCSRSIVYPLITHLLMGGGKPILSPNMICIFKKL